MNDDWYCSPTTEFSLPGATLFYRGRFLFGVISKPSPQGILCLSSSLGIYLGTLGIAKIQARSNRQSGNDIWADGNWTSGKVYFHSSTWSAAQNHYDYFSDPANGYLNGIINIDSYDENSERDIERIEKDIRNAAQTVQPGDLLYWGKNNDIHHATIVTKVENSHIFYSGNTEQRTDYDLQTAMSDNREPVHIIKLKDECFDYTDELS